MIKENRKYKDSVFTDLFGTDIYAEENARSLYNALHDVPVSEDTTVTLQKVENILYMNIRNDASFGVADKVFIIAEHQSTMNENMPLRDLLYIGRVLEQMIPLDVRYKRKKVMIPKPEFYTFYNGEETEEKEWIRKLSDSYKVKGRKQSLELKVKTININPSIGHEILDKCEVLKEYGIFVETVRIYRKTGEEEPIRKAIIDCKKAGILEEYLSRKGSEVENMLTAEYDYETDIRVQREEAAEDGEKRGEKRGIKKGIKQGVKQGVRQGERRMQELAKTLLNSGQLEEFQRALDDETYRKKLYKELNI